MLTTVTVHIMKTNTKPPSGRSINRRIHLIDAENLAFRSTTLVGEAAIADALRRYQQHCQIRDDDLDNAVVGCHPRFMFVARSSWPSAAVRVRSGRHGGETAVLKVVDPHRLIARWDEVWVASGDRAFLPLVLDLRRNGIPVVVVADRRGLSGALRRAATRVEYLDEAAASACAHPEVPAL